jgi:hypothetical protein
MGRSKKENFIMADMVKIRSTTDRTISLFDPTIPIRKTFAKRGAVATVERDKLVQFYFSSSLEDALRNGSLVIDDKNFLYEVGYITDTEEKVNTYELTPILMKRCIGVMPLAELVGELKKMSIDQIKELADFAVLNHNELKMDRIDVLSKASGKNILKAIELRRADQEV